MQHGIAESLRCIVNSLPACLFGTGPWGSVFFVVSVDESAFLSVCVFPVYLLLFPLISLCFCVCIRFPDYLLIFGIYFV